MQYELQVPRRMPVLCPSCGEVVSAAAPSCAVCGFANPSDPLAQAAPSCEVCDAKLGPEAKFCRNCGAAVGPTAQLAGELPPDEPFPDEPLADVVVPMPAHAPAIESVRHEPRRPVVYVPFDDLEDEVVDFPASSNSHDPLDYLDAQLGLKAPGADPVLLRPPAWRTARDLVPADEVHDDPPKAPIAPAAASRAPVGEGRSDSPTFATQVVIGFALFALLIAMLVHLVAPNAVPGYSAAELDFKVQMRAVEWLLAGVLVALVGLLLKR